MRRLLPLLSRSSSAAGALAGAAPPSRSPSASSRCPRSTAAGTDHPRRRTAHFVVDYYTDVDPTTDAAAQDYSTETEAGDIAAYAERAYAHVYSSWGYAAAGQRADGDRHHVDDLSGPPHGRGAAIDGAAPTRVGDSTRRNADGDGDHEALRPGDHGLTLAQEEQKVVAQRGLRRSSSFATWAHGQQRRLLAHRRRRAVGGVPSIGYPGGSCSTSLGPPDIALDCRDDLSAPAAAAAAVPHVRPGPLDEQGYTRWAFYQHAREQVRTSASSRPSFAKGATSPTATTALSSAHRREGKLARERVQRLRAAPHERQLRRPARSRRPPDRVTRPFAVGIGSADARKPSRSRSNHLAARYVTFQPRRRRRQTMRATPPTLVDHA